MTQPSPPRPNLKEIRERAEAATAGPWVAQLYHERSFAGRSHAFVTAGGIVPLAAVVLGVEGCSKEEGRANAVFIARARTNMPLLLDYIDTLLSEREWQPIETAPKDGTEFIGGNYGHHSDKWFVKILRWEPEFQWGAAFCDGYRRADPTHWMPLCEPPFRAMRENTE